MLPPKRNLPPARLTNAGPLIDPAWKSLPLETKCLRAKNARINEVWVNNKSGQTSTINQNGRRLFLTLANGKQTQVQIRHFASEYTPTLAAEIGAVAD